MRNKNTKPTHFNIFKLVSCIQDKRKRNLIRGHLNVGKISQKSADDIRRNSYNNDLVYIGSILRGPNGLLNDDSKGEKVNSFDVFRMTSLTPLFWREEVCYTSGYVNAFEKKVLEALELIEGISKAYVNNISEALQLIYELSKKNGVSNYLSYKLAYIRSSVDLTGENLEIISKIEDEIQHKKNPGLHFSALENISSKISLFLVARRRVSGLIGEISGDIRQSISLSNFVPTPINYDDLGGFLLRASESTLIDTVYSILIIYNLSDEFLSAKYEFSIRLRKSIHEKIESLSKSLSEFECGKIVTDYYQSQNSESCPSLDAYRVSSAFLEFPKYAKYRNDFDKVIGIRLLEEIIEKKYEPSIEIDFSKFEILSYDSKKINHPVVDNLDEFFRTYLFLKYINNTKNIISFEKDELKKIFENTIGLEVLLTEKEIELLYTTGPIESRSLTAVLALALYRKKSVDPDVDFEFRTDFIDHVKQNHDGKITKFIDDLLVDSPQVANYIVGSLDEVTLEKMYTLINNVTEASQIRSDILRAVGQKMNRIEYYVAADSITTRMKVSKLHKYFDSSRMYVDSVAMKKWLDTNPTVSTEQYRALYQRVETEIQSIKSPLALDVDIYLIKFNNQDEYLVKQIAKDAFKEFCLNEEFGIQSYLGRRIRHNTLDGVTTDIVLNVFNNNIYTPIMSNRSMRENINSWVDFYKSIIFKLKKDYLQFGTSTSLFSASFDEDDLTSQENIKSLTNSLRGARGSEILNELIIAFCWKQINPQLEYASRFIRTKLLKEANDSIDKYFSGYVSNLEAKMKSDLHEAVNDGFKKIADWFQVPETGYISASISDLCEIIKVDLNGKRVFSYDGNAVEKKFTGISVHRLYDCIAVLLQNALNHGKNDSDIVIKANSKKITSLTSFEMLELEVSSIIQDNEFSIAKNRIIAAVDSQEDGIDMITEGYTGIKKIKFITRTSEGSHTLRPFFDEDSKRICLSFSMRAEVAASD